jgi:hypothetical protein
MLIIFILIYIFFHSLFISGLYYVTFILRKYKTWLKIFQGTTFKFRIWGYRKCGYEELYLITCNELYGIMCQKINTFRFILHTVGLQDHILTIVPKYGIWKSMYIYVCVCWKNKKKNVDFKNISMSCQLFDNNMKTYVMQNNSREFPLLN